MKIIVVGTGFVGLPHAAVMAEYGHEVYAYDIDATRVAAYKTGEAEEIERYVNEPGLVSAIQETMGRYLFFTSDITDVVEGTDVFFFCLNTPPKRDGSTDLSYYTNAGHTVAKLLAERKDKKRVVLVNKSTVPVGTARLLQSIMNEHNVENFGVASNPEFLAQGNAVDGSRKPDRVVVGADTEEDFQ
ncbi:MAG: UDP-glucose/GDP-mannose dehydrogenase family protein, partial [Anaerolineales bacterium]|nr:UDP-glucose/GDP-mannose dehydrogenase family protein [Anaerolineales bacterium]